MTFFASSSTKQFNKMPPGSFQYSAEFRMQNLAAFNLSVLALFLVMPSRGDKFLSTYMMSEYHGERVLAL